MLLICCLCLIVCSAGRLFYLHIHYSRKFVREPKLKYENIKIAVLMIGMDKRSYFEVLDLANLLFVSHCL